MFGNIWFLLFEFAEPQVPTYRPEKCLRGRSALSDMPLRESCPRVRVSRREFAAVPMIYCAEEHGPVLAVFIVGPDGTSPVQSLDRYTRLKDCPPLGEYFVSVLFKP
jgi:hypothetical protein